MQQAMQQILVSTFLSKNWERKKIKLSITWTVIRSQWAFCIQLYISKTSYLIRNELDWCKNTGLLRSKVFTRVLVRLGQKTKCLFLKVEKRELHSHRLMYSSQPWYWRPRGCLRSSGKCRDQRIISWWATKSVTSVLCCHLVFLLEKNPKIKYF